MERPPAPRRAALGLAAAAVLALAAWLAIAVLLAPDPPSPALDAPAERAPPAASSAALEAAPVARAQDADGALRGSGAERRSQAAHRIVLRFVDAKGAGVPHLAAGWTWRAGPGRDEETDTRTDAEGRLVTRAERAEDVLEVRAVVLPGPDTGRGSVPTIVRAYGPFAGEPASPRELVFRVPARVALPGRVVDLAGHVQKHAELRIVGSPGDRSPDGVRLLACTEWKASTRPDGWFRLELFEGVYAIETRDPAARTYVELAAGVPPAPVDVLASSATRTVDVEIVLAPDGTRPANLQFFRLTARCLLDPLALRARATPGSWLEPIPFELTAEVDGPVTALPIAEPGEVVVTAQGAGREAASARVAPGQERLVLPLGARPEVETSVTLVTGHVKDAGGRGARARVDLLDAETLRVLANAASTPGGSFALGWNARSKPGASLLVRARSESGAAAIAGPFAPSERTQPIALVLAPGRSIRGRVVDPDGRPQHARVEARPSWRILRRAADGFADAVAVVEGAETDAQGAFVLEGLPEGAYELCAFPRAASLAPARLAVRAGDPDVVLRCGAAAGGRTAHVLVREVATGRPIAGAEVTIEREPPAPSGARVVTGADGRARIAGLAPGRVRIVARAAGHAIGRSEPIEIGEGEREHALELWPARSARLRFVDASGRGVPNLELVVTEAEGGAPIPLCTAAGEPDDFVGFTSLAGWIDLHRLPARSLRVEVGWGAGGKRDLYRSDGRGARVRVLEDPHATELDLTLPLGEPRRIVLP